MKHLLTQDQGFSISLNNSFTFIQNDEKSEQIRKEYKNSEYFIAANINDKQQQIDKTYADQFLSEPRSLYTYSPLYQNNHSQDYKPIYETKFHKKTQLSVLKEFEHQQSLLYHNNISINLGQQGKDNSNQLGSWDLLKASSDQIKDKNLCKIYCIRGIKKQNQGVHSTAAMLTLWQIKSGDNLLKLSPSNISNVFDKKINLQKRDRNINKFHIKSLQSSWCSQQSNKGSYNLQFYSNFESGNLHTVYTSLIIPNTYFLFLRNDTNTNGYTQWFNFYLKMSNKTADTNYMHRFFIMNSSKKIIYRKGMKIATKSPSKNDQIQINNKNVNRQNMPTSLKFQITQKKETWKRQIDMRYYESKQMKPDGNYLMITEFQMKQDALIQGIHIALSLPYTYSRLNKLMQQIIQLRKKSSICLQKVINIKKVGKSILGMNILSIQYNNNQKSSPQMIQKRKNNQTCEKLIKKHKVIILARQHPSQTVGSFICEYIIKRLTLNSIQENIDPKLKINSINDYQWYIIPCVNPDGVIHGNSRTNIKGYDVNRCWSRQNSSGSSETESIIKYLESINVQSDDYIIDLHGHSRQFGVFTFNAEKNKKAQKFNQFMSKLCPYFCLNKCTYKLQNSKKDTLRVQMFQRFKVKNCITIETSFYGFQNNTGQNQIYPYEENDFQVIAQSILKALDFLVLQKQSNLQNQINGEDNMKSFIQLPDNEIPSQSQTKVLIISQDASQQSIKVNQQQEPQNDDSDSNPEGQYLQDSQRKTLYAVKEIYKPEQKSMKFNKDGQQSFRKRQKGVGRNKNPQKLNLINLIEIKDKQQKDQTKTQNLNKFLQYFQATSTKSTNKNNKRISSSPEIRNIQKLNKPIQSNIPQINQINRFNTMNQSYYARKKFKNLYNFSAQRNQKLSKQKSKSFQRNNISNDGHKSKPKSQICTQRKQMIHLKTVCMQQSGFPSRNYIHNHQFLQNTLNINWKLKSRIQQELQMRENKKKHNENHNKTEININELRNIQRTSKLLRNIQKNRVKSHNYSTNNAVQQKLKKIFINSSRIDTLSAYHKNM